MNDNTSRDVRFEGDLGIANLNDIDFSKNIGAEDNPLYQLVFSRESKKKGTIKLINAVTQELLIASETVRLDNIGKALINKRSPTVSKVFEIFQDVESEDVTKRWLLNTATAIQQQYFNDPDDPAHPPDPRSTRARSYNISDDERSEALDLLRNTSILGIMNHELSRNVAGEETTRKYLILSAIQSFTEEYPQVTLVGESSIGKTWIANHVLNLMPPEYVKKFGRLSKTALERSKLELQNVRILYIQEARGKQAAADSIRLSSSSDGGMKALVTNAENGEVEELEVPCLSIWSTTTNLDLHHEDATRNVRVYLDASIEQTKKVIEYQAEDAEHPKDLKEALNWGEPSDLDRIRNAIRVLDKNMGVVVPYQTLVSPLLDTSRIRIKRDHKALIGLIKASALLHQFQREILIIDDKKWIVADGRDLKICLELSTKSMSQSFYSVDDLDDKLISILKRLEKDLTWTESGGGVYAKDIIIAVKEEMGYSRTWTQDRLKRLREDSKIFGEWVKGEGEAFGGYRYKTYNEGFDSIYNGEINYNDVSKKIDEWKSKVESVNRVRFDFL